MSAAGHTPGPWRVGETFGAIVSDSPVSGIRGSDNVEAYGGHLIAESVAQQNRALIAAAPELLAALQDFEIEECPSCNGTGKEHGTDEHNGCHRCGGAGEVLRGGWPAHVRAAIAKAQAAE